jgi:DNA-directed RNA polymerase
LLHGLTYTTEYSNNGKNSKLYFMHIMDLRQVFYRLSTTHLHALLPYPY